MADQGAEGLLSPYLRRKRMAAAAPFLRGRVLDIGCGSGHLARYVSATDYLGVDQDERVMRLARNLYPRHSFASEIPKGAKFDSIVALAAIEHLGDPAQSLKAWAVHLAPSGHVVLTTPHPFGGWLHQLGARCGLFSRQAAREHGRLLDLSALARAASIAHLRLVYYAQFLFGLNQLAILSGAGEPSAPALGFASVVGTPHAARSSEALPAEAAANSSSR